MIILSAADVRDALPMDEAIEGMKGAYAAFSDGRVQVPQRLQLSVPPHKATSLVMPAFVDDPSTSSLAVKVVSLFPQNPGRGLSFIQAAVIVLEADTGRPLALLEGSSLTAIRTGAASGAATDLLALPDSHTAAIFGAGIQGRTQLEAIATVRPIRTVWVYDPDPKQLSQFIDEMAGRSPIPNDIRPANSPQQAVADADLICTATTSMTPVFSDIHIKPGVHINAVGAYTPEMQEIPVETVSRAYVVVDSRSASLAEAGDLIQPLHQGVISIDHIQVEIGEIILGNQAGRSSPTEITLFKSVGIAAQDAVAARIALNNAEKLGLGQQVDW